jgi:FkbM family methyltransferase
LIAIGYFRKRCTRGGLSLLRRTIRNLFVGSPLEPLARNVFSRFDRKCRESTAEMRDNPQMKEIMRRCLKRDSTCLDIGANAGAMLEWMVSCAPEGQHHAFEPIPALAEDLRRRFAEVQVHAVALSDKTGTAEFNYVPSSTGYSGLKTERQRDISVPVEPITVPVETLDHLLPSSCVPRFIKIDVEGAEYHALLGGRQLLTRAKPLIIFEFGSQSLRFDVTPDMLFTLLCDDLGFRISRLNDWLDNGPWLSRLEFQKIYRKGLLWNFIAHPQR